MKILVYGLSHTKNCSVTLKMGQIRLPQGLRPGLHCGSGELTMLPPRPHSHPPRRCLPFDAYGISSRFLEAHPAIHGPL